MCAHRIMCFSLLCNFVFSLCVLEHVPGFVSNMKLCYTEARYWVIPVWLHHVCPYDSFYEQTLPNADKVAGRRSPAKRQGKQEGGNMKNNNTYINVVGFQKIFGFLHMS